MSLFQLNAMFAHDPSPDVRLRVLGTRDRTGVRRPALDWGWRRDERAGPARALELVRGLVRAADAGEVVDVHGLAGGAEPPISTGWHQMGGARMAADRSEGVVDHDLRHHQLLNLFVGGAAAFPTSAGHANPTLLLLALSLRLAELLGVRVPARRDDQPSGVPDDGDDMPPSSTRPQPA